MPPFFRKHAKTSFPPSQSQDTTASSSSATPETEESDHPSLLSESAAVSPEAANTGEDAVKKPPIEEAFQAVDRTEPAFRRYADGSKLRKGLDKTSEGITALQEKIGTLENVVEVVKPAYESDTMQTVRDFGTKVVDSLPALLKALDEVAKLHPFISIAVSAFRVVVELNLKRRENDKKVGLLFDGMRDMMVALLQLGRIKDKKIVGPTGHTVETRMKELVDKTASDITDCANICDAYTKKKTVVKVIQSPIWDSKLQGFISLFIERRHQFIFHISVHTGVGIDEATEKLGEIDAKIDLVLSLFLKAISPEQQELAKLVEQKGGPAVVMGNNGMLAELINFRPTTAALDRAKRSSGQEGAEHNSHKDGSEELAVVKRDLLETPELAIKKNWEVFECKLKMQQIELAEEMQRTVRDESARVIREVTDGPHNRIYDPDIQEIWKEMRWPGHVKARHFVLALRDYYNQKLERGLVLKDNNRDSAGSRPRVVAEDKWALEWININRLQAIVEAFDDDASGFITIAEVNYFTRSQPEGWSLPHWIAYWAIGWQMTTTKYRNMIVNICAKMFAMRPHIHPANRSVVDNYLQTVWQKVATLTLSFVNTNQPDSLQERFKSYVEAEEKRLREGLETFRYSIEAMDTLLLITGPGRIEKYLFPLLWLLLQRDFEIFRLCRHTIIHKDELWRSSDTILWVLHAVTERHNDLEALFKQQKLDPASQFRVFASELYDYWHDFDRVWTLENQQGRVFDEVEYNDRTEDRNVDVSKLLNYPLAPVAEDLYPPPVRDSAIESDASAEDAVQRILGRWHGVQISKNEAILSMPITFYFHASEDHRTYKASASAPNGTDYNIHGSYTVRDDGTVEYSLTQTYVARIPETYWTGTLADDGMTLSGRGGYTKEDRSHTFVYKRTPLAVLADRPPPEEFTQDRSKALWKYAWTVIRKQTRRRLCTAFSSSELRARRDVRNEYLELLFKETAGRLTKQDVERSSELAQLSTFEDVRCFYVIQEYRQRAAPPHFGIKCDNCGDLICGTRVVCLQCGSNFTFDFCDKNECVGCTIMKRRDTSSPHYPTHDFVKVRAPIVHYREIGRVLQNAKAGLERAKSLLEEMEYQQRSRQFAKNHEEVRAGDEEKGGEDGEGNEGDGDGQGEQDGEDNQAGERVSSLEREVASAREEVMVPSNSEAENGVVALTCLRCEVAISRPCLYCIDCPEQSRPFICWECDKQEAGFSHGDDHVAEHNLVRCMMVEAQQEDFFPWPPAAQEDNADDRLGALERKLEGLTGQMEELTSQIEQIGKLLHDLARTHRE